MPSWSIAHSLILGLTLVCTPIAGGLAKAQSPSAPDRDLDPRRLALPGPPVAAPSVGPGETILAFPYAFKRTAVLTKDVTGFTFTIRGVLAPAGSPGFYAGTFSSNATGAREVWCFLPPADAPRNKPLCLRLLPKFAQIIPEADPFDIQPFSSRLNAANPPVFEEKAVVIPGDLRLEYRFDGWEGETARVQLWTNGVLSRTMGYRKDTEGAVRIQTLAGELQLRPLAENPLRVQAMLAAP